MPTSKRVKSSLEAILWDHYVHRFARSYPTRSDAENPLLSCLIPIAVRHENVRCVLLAIAGLNAVTRNIPSLDLAVIEMRHRALACCQDLYSISRNPGHPNFGLEFDIFSFPESMLLLGEEDRLALVTTAIMMLVLGQLSGDAYGTLQTYIDFAQYYFDSRSSMDTARVSSTTPLHLFLRSVLVYHQILAMIAIPQVQSELYQENEGSAQDMSTPFYSPYYPQDFPCLIWRIYSDVAHVSLVDIDMWNGSLDFLPSVSTDPNGYRGALLKSQLHYEVATGPRMENYISKELLTVQEIYRIASRVYFFRQLRDSPGLIDSNTTRAYPPFIAQWWIRKLAKSAIRLLRTLADTSPFDTAVLLPLGLVAPELTAEDDRCFVLRKLDLLQRNLCFNFFGIFSQDLVNGWAQSDSSTSRIWGSSCTKELVRLIG